MPLSSSQKAAVSDFANFTRVDKKTAEKLLKATNWNVQQAVDRFYDESNTPSRSNSTTNALNKLFDSYRDDPTEHPDTIQINGSQKYFADLSISLDSITVFLISELLASPSLGEIPRDGFLSGWSSSSSTTLNAQKSHLKTLLSQLSTPEARSSPSGLYRRVYKHTFKLACPPGTRTCPVETAVEFWKILFSPAGFEWKTAKTNWFEWWLSFVQTRVRNAVNKDLWDQILLFALKTTEDESMAWWSDESSWPSVVDEFVAWVKERRESEGKMEVD